MTIPFDIVGFDLDGTLLDTSRDLGVALNHALGTIGRPEVPYEEVRNLIGGGTYPLKPDPAALHAMVKQCGGGRAAFVGDTTFDTRAAQAAAMPCVAVSFGFVDAPLHELGADAVIDHFDELARTLRTL
ncbi:MAG: hypothetical protein K2W91_14325 [Novosphingobium sp.]|nr:hypothetical protein [Novosphingobium sp.]